jgi:bifunctional oligoribonuclease and PAP phosphatase NrnA
MYTLQTFSTFLDTKLREVHKIALIAHKAPDGDAYGSLEGMKQLLNSNYPQLEVSILVPPEKQIDSHVNWILSSTPSPRVPPETELVIFMDASPLSRTALDPSDYPTQPIITIDHHEPQEDSVEWYRDTSAASTTIILTDIARTLNWTVTPNAATALLLGIYTDTGWFVHRNSNQRAFETAGFLMSSGADQSRITNETFGNHSISYLHDLGKWLLSIVQVWNIACLFFPETDNNSHLKSHIIGYLSGLANVDIACVLMQKWDEIKGSFRTRKESVDVNELAKKLGGGGHKKASGFTLPGIVDEKICTWNGVMYTPDSFIDYINTLL